MSNIADRVGKKLRCKRIEKGYTQEQVAELANLHPTYIGQVERGEKNLTIESLEKLCNALDYPMSDLMQNISSNGHDYSVADQCYDIIMNQSVDKQKELLRMIKYIVSYKN